MIYCEVLRPFRTFGLYCFSILQRYFLLDFIGVLKDEIQHHEHVVDAGQWGNMEYCDDRSFATGFRLKIQEDQGNAYDDSATNGIRIICSTGDYHSSIEAPRGRWSKTFMCPPEQYLRGWRQRVEASFSFDGTGMNNVEYKCAAMGDEGYTTVLPGNGLKWGSWTNYAYCPSGQFICGIKTRKEYSYGLTDIVHQCCEPRFSGKKMERMLKVVSSKERKRKLKDMKKVEELQSSAKEGHT